MIIALHLYGFCFVVRKCLPTALKAFEISFSLYFPKRFRSVEVDIENTLTLFCCSLSHLKHLTNQQLFAQTVFLYKCSPAIN